MIKKIKNILISASVFILMSTISICCISCAGPKEDTIKIGNFFCQRTGTELIIVGTDGTEGEDLIIPEKLDDISVIGIADNAFEKCKVKNYIVYKNIKHIGKNAFDSDSNFKIYMIGRKNTNGMDLSENWSGIGEVIYQDFSPDIDIRGKPILTPNVKPIPLEKFIDTGDDNKNLGLNKKDVNSTAKYVEGDFSSNNKNTNSTNYLNNTAKQKIKALSKIKITSPPIKTTYIEGNIFDEKGMVVTAFYTDETTSIINVYSFSNQKLAKGLTSITLTYKEKDIERTAIQPITVVPKTPIKLEITSPPIKTTYIEDTAFDRTGLVAEVSYDNGDTANILNYTVPTGSLVLGQTYVELRYTENSKTVKTNQQITIIRKVPISLKVTNSPNKIKYVEGEKFDTKGMTITVTYNNGKTALIIPIFSTNDLILGQDKIDLKYSENDAEVTTQQAITVIKKSPVKLEITTPPSKTTYIEETYFNPYGMVITVTYDNGKSEEITSYTYLKNPLKIGQTYVKFEYIENGKIVACQQAITVIKKSPVNLEITTPPNKTKYIEGNVFDKTGMVVKVSYDNGYAPNITNFIVPTDKLIKGTTSITISYKENGNEVIAFQSITVVAKTPTKLEVTKQPTKTNYSAGLIFRPLGMIVKISYDNSDINNNVTSYTYPAERLAEGQTVVKISYSENSKTVTCNVSIIVGPQLAVYEKHNCVLTTCSTCSGHGKVSSTGTCSSCGGDGRVSGTHSCSSCGGSGQTFYQCPICARHDGTGYHICTGSGYETCSSCGGSGSSSYSYTCSSCSGSGSRTITVTCSTCRGTGNHGYKKTTYLSDVTVVANTLPADGRHTDGSWYVLKHLIQDEIPVRQTSKKRKLIK